MEANDTVKLLRECDAGIKMGILSIDEALPSVTNEQLKQALAASKQEHENLKNEVTSLLNTLNADGKEPNPVAKTMSWMKTNIKLTVDHSDQAVADLITDGCNMGVKTLHRYLNQYANAEENAKDITRRLIAAEEKLAVDLRCFL
ncbi:MAG TPA: hypothetical protein PLD48_01100 [Bacillota bacterium]|mgnify:FL=1|nr:hypothetical protein [Bacillota bacterium]HOK68313.1 hypothetical protein [Bacillota bacterium]HPP85481.1 hypothetical protein [Bacillota bacterium]